MQYRIIEKEGWFEAQRRRCWPFRWQPIFETMAVEAPDGNRHYLRYCEFRDVEDARDVIAGDQRRRHVNLVVVEEFRG